MPRQHHCRRTPRNQKLSIGCLPRDTLESRLPGRTTAKTPAPTPYARPFYERPADADTRRTRRPKTKPLGTWTPKGYVTQP
ncbi:hypothetical protein GCM10023084_44220 [Streptomyces lacrimifluminis]|uniref:Uncharacterized protein n=1 Tax=Streptomyces lacrimifluminis TaxID=1500077 RepID=A0A917L5J6_9ACTN|nr:hypothetical protein GCM10012282_48620 [Streptomyces lacrimifluminis]